MRVLGWLVAGCVLSMLYVSSVPAQIGGGGGQFSSLGVWVSSGDVTVVVAKSRDSAAAWSRTTGEWKRIEFKAKDTDALVAVVGDDVTAFRAGDRIFAFGGESGQWDSIAVSEKLQSVPVVGHGYASVEEDGKYFIFSSKVGKWSGVELASAKLVTNE